ncbi:MAG: sigma-54-dependent Fis family transcriptional regulator [Desulfobacteraceae bacterium]|nr:sigma-54-dependent Fis family transcriptional regulator [Desulfobacteraceae bacterium]
MDNSSFDLFKSFAGELDPEILQKKFLNALLKLQDVSRGSIWIRKNGMYECIEAAGDERDNIRGVTLSTRQSSIVGWVIENGKMTVSDPGRDERHYRELEENLAVKSSLILCFPLFLKDRSVYGAVQVIDTSPDKRHLNLDKSYLANLQNLVDIGSVALGNAVLYREKLQETESLKTALKEYQEGKLIVGHSRAFQSCMELVKSYAKSDFPVLITGESGTGKELVAERLHRSGIRKDKPFLVQNCSSIPETLLESELFGYKKGAFSGAVKDKKGLFEAADGGTVFLDEIGDMPMNIQASILRVLQNNEVKPLGSTRVRHVDVRILSATHREIKKMVAENTFRQDLFYRLAVLPIHMPSLRERREDIPLLVKHFLAKEGAKAGAVPKGVGSEAMRRLTAWSWPGNIRELENLIKYLMVVTEGDAIDPEAISLDFERAGTGGGGEMPLPQVPGQEARLPARDARPGEIDFGNCTWLEVEKNYALYLLEKNSWNVTWAARDSGLNRSTFASRLRRLGIRKQKR